jgi:NhaA family Na+:H+ antiporter
MILTKLYREFFNSEKAGGIILLLMVILSLVLANSMWGPDYIGFWNRSFAGHSIIHWINDGLMTIFFLLIGLELEREIYQGELSNYRNASLPIFGAIGGMVIPAGIFLLLNFRTGTQAGAGIPMATDIAFAIGILSLLGNRVPASLKIFLTALAVIDDLGAIIIIAVFYTGSLSFANLGIALGIFCVLILINKLRVSNLILYIIGGIAMWYFMSNSGIHATISGVLLAFTILFGERKEESPSYVLQHFLHKPVAFFILPLFALANTCIMLGTNVTDGLLENHSVGIMAGLVIGKPLGIWLFSFVGAGLGLCTLPPDLKWKNIIGTGFLAGIGFTMSIFIALLAFDDPGLILSSKLAIFAGSVIAGLSGFLILRLTLKMPSGDYQNN